MQMILCFPLPSLYCEHFTTPAPISPSGILGRQDAPVTVFPNLHLSFYYPQVPFFGQERIKVALFRITARLSHPLPCSFLLRGLQELNDTNFPQRTYLLLLPFRDAWALVPHEQRSPRLSRPAASKVESQRTTLYWECTDTMSPEYPLTEPPLPETALSFAHPHLIPDVPCPQTPRGLRARHLPIRYREHNRRPQ